MNNNSTSKIQTKADKQIALAGNPNSGKTTLFNELTGSRQHVGNYPGITVEKKQGTCIQDGHKINIVDLPGIYSLSAYSIEEVVARDFLINEKPSAVIDIVDASNLERNLYLTVQFLELGIPLCIALNMMDEAETRGMRIDEKRLSRILGVAVIPTVARSAKGKDQLMAAVIEMMSHNKEYTPLEISYGSDVDSALLTMTKEISTADFLTERYAARWTALKYLENDAQMIAAGQEKNPVLSAWLLQIREKLARHLKDTLDTYPEAMIADSRYGYINAILKQGVVQYSHDENKLYLSDKIDKFVIHRFSGPLIMTAVLVGLYQFTFTYSEAPIKWIEAFFEWVHTMAASALPPGLLQSLVVSGIIDGVGGVLGFVPLIMFMFLGISILEDSGYIARVAFMLDRVFRMFGLHGNSVMPYIVSGGIAGGCAVPGVMAARTLKSQKERLATLLTVPFMNCGAKLPVFALLISAFFVNHKAQIMFAITAISWAMALLAAKFLRLTVIKGESTPFVMELPPYRLPTLKGLIIHTWERTWQYIKKAGTVILGISILVWAMMTFPQLPEEREQMFAREQLVMHSAYPAAVANELSAKNDQENLSSAARALKNKLSHIEGKRAEAALRHSLAGRFGIAIEGISKWAGFDWRTNIALVGGFAAKEVIVSTLGIAYSLADIDTEAFDSLSETLAHSPNWNPLAAFSLMLFVLFYAPCFITVVTIARESGSWKWGFFSMAFNTIIAFMISVVVFQAGSFLGIGIRP